MNLDVYLFGKLGGSYTQYPDDYSREVFSEFENNIKSPSQLMIHRHNELIYYGYLRQLSIRDKYIGIAFVFNGVMCTDITYLSKLCEDNITNWIVNGEILEFDDNGDIISKVDKLYKTASEFKRLSESLSAQIDSAKLPFQKLPPINFAVSSSAVKTFNIDDNNIEFNNALREYCNIYIYSESKSETLNGFSDKLRRLNKENITLKEENAKILREKKRTTIVTILLIFVAVGVILVVFFVNRSSAQVKHINVLTANNEQLKSYINNLRRDSTSLNYKIRSLEYDKEVLEDKNRKLQSDLYFAHDTIENYQDIFYQNNIYIDSDELYTTDNKINNFPVINGKFKTKSGVFITIPTCLVAYKHSGSIDYFYSVDESIVLCISIEDFYSLQSAYDLWTENDYGKNITYHTINNNFAVVSWWDNYQEDGYYCRAERINGKIHVWILKWDQSVHKKVKPLLDRQEIKFIYR